jgi:hypothetical protein
MKTTEPSLQKQNAASGQKALQPMTGKSGANPFQLLGKKELLPAESIPVQKKHNPMQLLADKMYHPIQRKENNTGMPDLLKNGIEQLSGYAMDDVKVHYNSDKPAQLEALAYAQGTDIHIGAGQENHLAHEAWHVVQQKQGRVQATMQMKMGVPVNDDPGLEQEADVKGAQALATGNNIAPALLKEKQGQNATAIQRRIPVMNAEFIKNNRSMAIDILLHALKNMSKEEFIAMNAATTHPGSWNFSDVTVTIQEGNTEVIHEWYKHIYEYTEGNKKFVNKAGENNKAVGLIQKETINNQIAREVLPALLKMTSNVALHQLIFGPACDSSYLNAVFKGIHDRLLAHGKKNTSPVVVPGDEMHKKWVKVEGSASPGASVVNVTQSGFDNILAGTPDGFSLLVHEFSHAVAGTKDIAYDLIAMGKLTTDQRMQNAETYAHAFLECYTASNPARHYDAEKISDSSQSHVAQPKNLKIRLGGINKLIIKMWNNVDGVYESYKNFTTLQGLQPAIQEKINQIIYTAIFPYRPSFTNTDIIMAFIEDRTHVLAKFMTGSNVIKALKQNEITTTYMKSKIEGEQEYERLAAIAMKNDLNMNLETALFYVREAAKIENFLQQIRAIDEGQNDAVKLLATIKTESDEVTSVLNTGEKANYHTLSALLKLYKEKGYPEKALQPYTKTQTRAIGRSIQRS